MVEKEPIHDETLLKNLIIYLCKDTRKWHFYRVLDSRLPFFNLTSNKTSLPAVFIFKTFVNILVSNLKNFDKLSLPLKG